MADVKLHHIGILVKDIAAAACAYAKRFRYEVRSPVIHDPVQTAYVQFLALPGDSSFVEFVSPDGPDSKLSNALRKGGGLNHICYSTETIDSTCEELGAEGMHLIQAPVPAVAFPGRRIAWLMGRDGVLTELVERGGDVAP